MRLGITSKSDAYSWSSIRQQVTIPWNAASATLSFWYYPICQDTVEYDWQEAIIYDATVTHKLAYAMPQVCSNSQTWTHRTFDLTPYKGQTITLYFNVKNDGVGNLKTAMYLDDVSVQVCY
jgi:bacillopeptidase F (M6 metalloprotease family)